MFTTDDHKKFSTKLRRLFSKKPKTQPRTRAPSDSPTAYHNLAMVKKLGKGRFPIYLTSSKFNNQNYAMKIFSPAGQDTPDYFKNEIRFASLKHPNVIDMYQHEYQNDPLQKGEVKRNSYILMEYAPYGDFFDFITKYKNHVDEKLVRTYFRQMIDGLEYLHANNIAHLDLKPENLLIGADFSLKIADFDVSHIHGDKDILSRGTRFYRAPEFYKSDKNAPSDLDLLKLFAADVYSAGVVLFILKCAIYPHRESGASNGVSFENLLYQDNQAFWAKHCEIQRRDPLFFSEDFKELFNNMVKLDPKERWTIRQVKESRWYNGPIHTQLELKEKMKKILNC